MRLGHAADLSAFLSSSLDVAVAPAGLDVQPDTSSIDNNIREKRIIVPSPSKRIHDTDIVLCRCIAGTSEKVLSKHCIRNLFYTSELQTNSEAHLPRSDYVACNGSVNVFRSHQLNVCFSQ